MKRKKKSELSRAASVTLACTALACAALAIARAEPEPVRVDGLAAVVGGQAPGPGVDIILQSDVELRARMTESGRSPAPPALDPLPDSQRAAALNEIIGEHLIAREARRVQAANPSNADIERERRQLVHSAGGEQRLLALLRLLGAMPDELDVVAKRRALVGAFLSANLEGVTVVTDAELERAVQAKQQEGDTRDPAERRLELRAQLARAALDRTIERWVTVLRSRTPLRVYIRY